MFQTVFYAICIIYSLNCYKLIFIYFSIALLIIKVSIILYIYISTLRLNITPECPCIDSTFLNNDGNCEFCDKKCFSCEN